MKTFVAAFALASIAATSAWAKTESPVAIRSGILIKAARTVAQPARHSYALMLGVAY